MCEKQMCETEGFEVETPVDFLRKLVDFLLEEFEVIDSLYILYQHLNNLRIES